MFSRTQPPAILAALLLTGAAWAADCSGTSTSLRPLNDAFVFSYQGLKAGLYPDGNLRPAGHESSGMRLAREVQPRDISGGVDPQDGRIVFISVGMSNTTQEFSVFKRLADSDPEKNPRLVIVDGAQGGWSAERINAGGAAYWATLDARLAAAGVTGAQVQAAWMKQANARPALPFPNDARRLQSDLMTLARTLRSRFPNLRLLYLSSRIYAGYASTNLNPEPFAYQSGFAVKWLIESQILGDPALSYESGQAPWLAWGPYLWADGTRRRHDGLVWNCSDFQQDGTHPADTARQKVAAMLLNFLKSDTTARTWFVRTPDAGTPKPKPAVVLNAASYTNEVAAGSIATVFGLDLASGEFSAASLPLPTALGATMVRIGRELALLYYVSPGQVNFVVPPAPAGGALVITRDGVESDAIPLAVRTHAPGVFTLDGRPNGPAAALDESNHVIASDNPASSGKAVQLFLTGLGVRNPLSLMPEILPVVSVGGGGAQVSYYGLSPVYPGLDQINFTVPPDSPTGLRVPLRVELGGSISNEAILPVGP